MKKKDKNKDNVLTHDEFANANLFRLGDVDKDGTLTLQEYQRAYKMQFNRAHDKNGDGYISGSEIQSVLLTVGFYEGLEISQA